jgi:hypothetical protein
VESRDVLVDAFGRVRDIVRGVVDGLTVDELSFRPAPHGNSIAWLVWHLTRIEDDHVAHLADRQQAWTGGDWHERFGLPFDPGATGYGHSTEEVARVRVAGELLVGYQDAVHDECVRYLGTVDGTELDRVVDTRWDPPVTAGVRLVSVIGDAFEHAGQAAYVRGLILDEG